MASYLLPPVAIEIVRGVASVTSTIIRFTIKGVAATLSPDLRVALEFREVINRGLSEQAMQTLFSKQINTACAEYIIPNGTYKNLRVKITQNEAMVGSFDLVNGETKLTIRGYVNGKSYNVSSLTESRVSNIAEDVMSLSLIRQLVAKPTYLPNRIIFSDYYRTTTLIGKWSNELQKVYQKLSEADLNVYMQSGKFDNKRGFNMLSIENWDNVVNEAAAQSIAKDTKAFDDFIWNRYNKPWLQHTLERGDEIVLWSNPENLVKTIYKDGTIGPSFYKRELDFLRANSANYGYDYQNSIIQGLFKK